VGRLPATIRIFIDSSAKSLKINRKGRKEERKDRQSKSTFYFASLAVLASSLRSLRFSLPGILFRAYGFVLDFLPLLNKGVDT
jgi:hypothetical protein